MNPSIPPARTQPLLNQPATINANPHNSDFRRRASSFADSRQPCNNFNIGTCTREHGRYLHIYATSAAVLVTVLYALCLKLSIKKQIFKNDFPTLLFSLKHSFKTVVECLLSQNTICNNLQSTLAQPDIVNNLNKKEVELGFMISPFDDPPFKVFYISPIGVATRKFSGRKHLIIDLSALHNSSFPNINSLILLNKFFLNHNDIDHAIEMIKIVDRGTWLAKIDIMSAFKVMPIHPDSWH